jgi:hypothetical protein
LSFQFKNSCVTVNLNVGRNLTIENKHGPGNPFMGNVTLNFAVPSDSSIISMTGSAELNAAREVHVPSLFRHEGPVAIAIPSPLYFAAQPSDGPSWGRLPRIWILKIPVGL